MAEVQPTELDHSTAATAAEPGSEVEADAGLTGEVDSDDEPSRRVRETNQAQSTDPHFVDESRYMKDENGNMLLKWKVDYATRGGGGRAMCKDLDCLERHSQGGVRTIEKGELRIGRRVLTDKGEGQANIVMLWYHARCMFNCFLRSRKTTRVIESAEDLDGWESISYEDQQMLRRIMEGSEDVRAAKSRATGSRTTPQKRGPGEDATTPASKRLKGEGRMLRPGDRVWTYCRVRAPTAPGSGIITELPIKSQKPELGMLLEEEKDGTFLIQFESAEHEKERIEKSQERKYAKIRAWLRYPRIFEGKKQRISVAWVQLKRPAPKLCGCIKQEWAHSCSCGIACTPGSSSTVFGVCQG